MPVILWVCCEPCRLLCFCGGHIDELATIAAFSEEHCAVDERVEGVVFAHTHVKTGMMYSTALALDDIACLSILTTENLNSKSFAF